MSKKSRNNESGKHGKTPGERENETGSLIYPWWAKLIVSLTIVSWGACIAIFAVSVQACVTMGRQATNPVFVAENLRKIARIERLPEGFKSTFAATVFNTSFLALNYVPDGSGIMIWLLPSEDRKATARDLTDSMAEKGMIPTIADEFRVDKKGSMPVAGETMEYVTGVGSQRHGRTVGGFIGCAVLKDKRALLIYAWTPPGPGKHKMANAGSSDEPVSFNMDALNSLLSAIKSF